MDPVKIAQHSKELLLEIVNAKKLSALQPKDFYQMVNVKNVNLTQELSLEVRPVHQSLYLKRKNTTRRNMRAMSKLQKNYTRSQRLCIISMYC